MDPRKSWKKEWKLTTYTDTLADLFLHFLHMLNIVNYCVLLYSMSNSESSKIKPDSNKGRKMCILCIFIERMFLFDVAIQLQTTLYNTNIGLNV